MRLTPTAAPLAQADPTPAPPLPPAPFIAPDLPSIFPATIPGSRRHADVRRLRQHRQQHHGAYHCCDCTVAAGDTAVCTSRVARCSSV